MRVLRLIDTIIGAFGAVLAASMFALILYAHSVRSTAVPIVPILLLDLGVVLAVVGLLLLVIALIGLHFKNKQSRQPVETH